MVDSHSWGMHERQRDQSKIKREGEGESKWAAWGIDVKADQGHWDTKAESREEILLMPTGWVLVQCS